MRNINLLPLEYRPEPKFVVKRFATVLVIALLIISIFTGFLVLTINMASNNKILDIKKANIELMENRLRAIHVENTHLLKIKAMVAAIEKIEKKSIGQVEVLDDLKKHTPMGVTLTNISVFPEGITLSAHAVSMEEISLFLQSLNSWEKYENFFLPQINLVEEQYVFQVQGRLRRGE